MVFFFFFTKILILKISPTHLSINYICKYPNLLKFKKKKKKTANQIADPSHVLIFQFCDALMSESSKPMRDEHVGNDS